MTRLLTPAVVVVAAPFVLSPRLGALAAVVLTVLLVAWRGWHQLQRARALVRAAEASARRADALGFVNPPVPRRRRSPDQWLTRAGPVSTPRVLDDMPGRIAR